MTPAISVVLPTYQRRDAVARTVASLRAQDASAPFEVVVVDNGSTDGTAQDLAELAATDGRLRVLRIEVNRGPGPARNEGWRAARAPLVAFVDDDTEPAPGWLTAVLGAFDGGADVVMGATLPDPDVDAGPFSHWVKVERSMPWFPTCNIAYRRSLLERLGGFDESFTARHGASFGDDTDLGWRALEAGADARFVPGARVHHEVTVSDVRRHLRAVRRRRGVPAVVARHPGLRAQLPLPYVYTREHARAGLAALGAVVVAVRPRSAAAWVTATVLARPYVAYRTTGDGVRPGRHARSPWVLAGLLVSDLAEIAVVARQAWRERTLLL